MKYALAVLLLALLPWRIARSEPGLTFVEKVLGGDATEPLPMVIALHGLGDSPEHFSALYDGFDVPMRLIAPRAPDPYEVGTSWFPIDEHTRAPAVIQQRAKELVELVEALMKTRPTRGLPIVTGFSQGGFMSYALAAYYSEHFSAALPIAGMLPAALPVFKKARPAFRVIAFHGKADKRVTYADDQRTVARLKQAGTNVTLAGYEGVPHGISPKLERDYFAALREELDRAR
jgi:phospholipase/carboxylesterase